MKPGTATLALTLLLAACGGDDPSGPPYAAFSGEWRGSVAGITVRIDEVTDVDGEITGTGRLQAATTINISIAGDHDHPDISFTGYATGFENFEFEGRFESEDTVRGRANGSGFSEDPLILIRQ